MSTAAPSAASALAVPSSKLAGALVVARRFSATLMAFSRQQGDGPPPPAAAGPESPSAAAADVAADVESSRNAAAAHIAMLQRLFQDATALPTSRQMLRADGSSRRLPVAALPSAALRGPTARRSSIDPPSDVDDGSPLLAALCDVQLALRDQRLSASAALLLDDAANATQTVDSVDVSAEPAGRAAQTPPRPVASPGEAVLHAVVDLFPGSALAMSDITADYDAMDKFVFEFMNEQWDALQQQGGTAMAGRAAPPVTSAALQVAGVTPVASPAGARNVQLSHAGSLAFDELQYHRWADRNRDGRRHERGVLGTASIEELACMLQPSSPAAMQKLFLSLGAFDPCDPSALDAFLYAVSLSTAAAAAPPAPAASRSNLLTPAALSSRAASPRDGPSPMGHSMGRPVIPPTPSVFSPPSGGGPSAKAIGRGGPRHPRPPSVAATLTAGLLLPLVMPRLANDLGIPPALFWRYVRLMAPSATALHPPAVNYEQFSSIMRLHAFVLRRHAEFVTAFGEFSRRLEAGSRIRRQQSRRGMAPTALSLASASMRTAAAVDSAHLLVPSLTVTTASPKLSRAASLLQRAAASVILSPAVLAVPVADAALIAPSQPHPRPPCMTRSLVPTMSITIDDALPPASPSAPLSAKGRADVAADELQLGVSGITQISDEDDRDVADSGDDDGNDATGDSSDDEGSSDRDSVTRPLRRRLRALKAPPHTAGARTTEWVRHHDTPASVEHVSRLLATARRVTEAGHAALQREASLRRYKHVTSKCLRASNAVAASGRAIREERDLAARDDASMAPFLPSGRFDHQGSSAALQGPSPLRSGRAATGIPTSRHPPPSHGSTTQTAATLPQSGFASPSTGTRRAPPPPFARHRSDENKWVTAIAAAFLGVPKSIASDSLDAPTSDRLLAPRVFSSQWQPAGNTESPNKGAVDHARADFGEGRVIAPSRRLPDDPTDPPMNPATAVAIPRPPRRPQSACPLPKAPIATSATDPCCDGVTYAPGPSPAGITEVTQATLEAERLASITDDFHRQVLQRYRQTFREAAYAP